MFNKIYISDCRFIAINIIVDAIDHKTICEGGGSGADEGEGQQNGA